MHILLNSDVLWADYTWTDLPPKVKLFADTCRDQGHVIVIPETAKLEFDRKQNETVDKARIELERAYSALEKYKVSYTKIEATSLITPPDLPSLITATGATVKVHAPILEDFQEAHKRACLHLSPQPPDTKSDEMRDLVIWMIAIRISHDWGGALLVSRDEVHIHGRGDAEAQLSQLVRVRSFEEALEYLEVETPAGQLLRRLMIPAWTGLARKGLPVSSNPTVLSVSDPVFVQGDDGLAAASCVMKVRTTDGKSLRAAVAIENLGAIQRVVLTNLDGAGEQPEPLSIETDALKAEAVDVSEALSELRRTLEGEA